MDRYKERYQEQTDIKRDIKQNIQIWREILSITDRYKERYWAEQTDKKRDIGQTMRTMFQFHGVADLYGDETHVSKNFANIEDRLWLHLEEFQPIFALSHLSMIPRSVGRQTAGKSINQSVNQIFAYWRKNPFWHTHRRGKEEENQNSPSSVWWSHFLSLNMGGRVNSPLPHRLIFSLMAYGQWFIIAVC